MAPLEGKNLKYHQKETRPFGQSLVYKVIPPDYFYTIEEKPQVIVNIDEYPALCVNLDCDYTYIEQQSEITAFTVSGDDVTITAKSLKTLDPDYTVKIANIECEITSQTETEIQCVMQSSIPAGAWLPRVLDGMGLVKIDPAVEEYVVQLTISKITPRKGLNPAGGDIVTIKGQNLPSSLESASGLEIEF